jgi:hypothetical protein
LRDWLPDDAVCCEPVSVERLTLTAGDATEKFAVHGKKTGNRANARGELTKKSPFRLGFGAGSLKPGNREL